jgi:hypothetical protein
MRYGFGSWVALCGLLLSAACSSPEEGGEIVVDLGTPLLAEGTAGDRCAPNDGPALTFNIGTASTCTVPPGSEPQIHLLVYPGSTSTLAAGQSWSFDEGTVGEEVNAWWYPAGLSVMPKYPKSGFVEVLSVSLVKVEVRYSFVVLNEDKEPEKYGGEVSLWLCPSMQMCG